jgi:hypothetical protein
MSSFPPPPGSTPPPPPGFPPGPPSGPPPGYVAYGGAGAVPRNVQTIGGLTKALWILVAIFIPFQVLSMFGSIATANRAQDFLDGTISESEFTNGAGIAGSLGGLLVVPIAVLTMIWMFRMASNLQALGRQGQTWKPGWAIGGWFVPPCVLYVIPWLMFGELWKGSDPEVSAGDPSWKQSRVAPIVHVWWVLYGLAPIATFFVSVGQFTNFNTDPDEMAENLAGTTGTIIASSMIGLAAAVVYLLLVRQLGDRHMRAIRER